MIYPILLVIAAIVLAMFLWSWLSTELRNGAAWLRDRVRLARGGKTQQRLLDETRRAFEARGLEADCILVSSQVAPVYDNLRRQYIGRRPVVPLPVAVALALGTDVDAGYLFLRAVTAGVGEVGRDASEFFPFADVSRIEQVAQDLPEGIAPTAPRALEIVTGDSECPRRYRLALEDEWGVRGSDLVERVRAMIEDRRKPDPAPLIVR